MVGPKLRPTCRAGYEFQSGWADHSSRIRRDRRPRQRRVTGGGVPAVPLGHLERRASGGHRGLAEAGGDPSDAPVGRSRTPNVPARGRGASEGVLLGRSGRQRTGAGCVTRPGSRGPASMEVRGPACDSRAARARRCVRIWSITDVCVMKATMRIAPWQVGHASGSTSKNCWSSAAHRRVASVGASRGAGTMAGGPSAVASAAFPRVPRGRFVGLTVQARPRCHPCLRHEETPQLPIDGGVGRRRSARSCCIVALDSVEFATGLAARLNDWFSR